MVEAAAVVATMLLPLRSVATAVSPRAQRAADTVRKMITNPAAVTAVTAVETAMAATEEATVEVAVATETADLEVVTNPVATAVAPATRVVIITKEMVVKWSPKRIRSSSRA